MKSWKLPFKSAKNSATKVDNKSLWVYNTNINSQNGTKMTALTKTQVSAIRADLALAFGLIAKKHGVDFSLGTIRFNAESMRGTLSGVVRGAAGTSVTSPVDVKSLALTKTGKSLLGASFDATAKYRSPTLGVVSFVGYNSRARAYPFVVVTSAGKRYKIGSNAATSMVTAGVVA